MLARGDSGEAELLGSATAAIGGCPAPYTPPPRSALLVALIK